MSHSAGNFQTELRPLPTPDRCCVHAYYSLSPYAPDGSGRLLLAGADLSRGNGEVLLLDAERRLIGRFGSEPVQPSFRHTGRWQSWSPDRRYVSYQSGTLNTPRVVRRELATREQVEIKGDLDATCVEILLR